MMDKDRTLAYRIGRFIIFYAIFLAIIFATVWAFIGLYFTLNWFFGKTINPVAAALSAGLLFLLILFALSQAIWHRK